MTRKFNNNVLEICDDELNVVLSIQEEMVDESMYILFSGQITNDVAHEFEDEVMAAFTACKNIKIDLKNVSYIASLALKSLLSVQQMIDEIENSSMVLVNVSAEVMEILKESGFSEILLIESK